MNKRTLILFALEREAAPFRKRVGNRSNCAIFLTGIGVCAARKTAENLIQRHTPTHVIMAGFCGALHSKFHVGDVICATEVIDCNSNVWPCLNIGQPQARLITVSQIVATPTEKRALAQHYYADIVDMESAAVAAVCQDHGVPFLAMRAVSDTSETLLSPRLANMLSHSKVSPFRASLAIFKQPSILYEFHRLARDTRTASRQLAEQLLTITDSRKSLTQ